MFKRSGAIFLSLGLAALFLAAAYLVLTVSAAPAAPPLPLTQQPPANSHTTALTSTVSLLYDQPMDPATVSSGTFAVQAMQTGLLTATYGVNGGQISLTPTQPFKPGELVQVSASTATLNFGGEGPISPTVWQFRAEVPAQSGFFVNSGQQLAGGSEAVVLGDLDGDGDLDAFAANRPTYDSGCSCSVGGADKVWLNNGQAVFVDSGQVFEEWLSRNIVLGDLDGDGDLDSVINYQEANPIPAMIVYFNDGSGTFVESGQDFGTSSIGSLTLGDLDGDGDLDLYVGKSSGDQVWFNDGSGHFSNSGQSLATIYGDVALGDLDGDGDLDAFLGNATFDDPNLQPNQVWFNDGSGHFTDSGQRLGIGQSPAVVLGDLDGDGDLDAFSTHIDETVGWSFANRAWFNDGSGFFTPNEQSFTNYEAWYLDIGDLDGDGDLDIFVPNANNTLLFNDGSGRFSRSGQAPGSSHETDVALGDLDGDGDLDAFVTNYLYQEVWFNENPADLALTKAQQVLGSAITYTLAFSNHGPGLASGVVLTDLIPAELQNVTVSSSGAAVTATAGVSFSWQVADLPPGAGGSIIIAGTFSAPGAVYNKAQIETASPDPDLANNIARAAFNDLHVTAHTPAANGLDVAAGQTISVTFNRPLSGSTVSSGTFAAFGQFSGLISGSYTVAGGSAWLQPAAPLKPGEPVHVTLGGSIQAGDGPVSLTPFAWDLTAESLAAQAIFTDSGQLLGSGSTAGLALGDLDGDGDLDAFVAHESQWDWDCTCETGGGLFVWLNQGGLQGGTPGTFVDSGQSLGTANSSDVALGDLDKDGDLDAFVANRPVYDSDCSCDLGGENTVWINDGLGSFSDSGQALGAYRSEGVSLGDLDGDGDLDAFVVNEYRYSYPADLHHQEMVWLNDGSGHFTAGEALLSPLAGDSADVSLGDVDRDGDLDALVIDTFNGSRLWFNDGDGRFFFSGQRYGYSRHAQLGDLDGDGDLDIFEAGYFEARAWFNQGGLQGGVEGQFIDSGQRLNYGGPASDPAQVTLADFDGDGDLDALVVSVEKGTLQVDFPPAPPLLWLNDGQGSFSLQPQPLPALDQSAAAAGDLDGDGDLDLFVGRPDAPNQVLFNEDTTVGSLTIVKEANPADGTDFHFSLESDGAPPFIAQLGSRIAPDGQLQAPYDITVDAAGNSYVTDIGNYRIQKFDPAGNHLLSFGSEGTGDGQFKAVWGVAVDAYGNVYVSDAVNNRIQKFDPSGNFLLKWGSEGTGNGQFMFPTGLTVDSSGSVYVTDNENHRIQKFDSEGSFLLKWGSEGAGDGQFDYPYDVAVDGSGHVYVADASNNRIQKFDANGNHLLSWGSEGTGDDQFGWPWGVGTDSSGNVYVVDVGNYRTQKFDSTGTFLLKWGTIGSGDGQFLSPVGLTTDSQDNVYVVDVQNHRIQKFDSSGSFLFAWGEPAEFLGPEDIASDSAGNVYIADTEHSRIRRFDTDGNHLLSWGSFGNGDGLFRWPGSVAADNNGSIYVINDEQIQKFDSDGNFLLKWGSYGSGDGEFWGPADAAVDDAGNVYVADNNNNRIQKFDGDGNFLLKWGSQGTGDGQFSYPSGIATDRYGNVYVADSGNYRIQKFDSNGNFLLKWGSQGTGDGQFLGVEAVAVDTAGNVYALDKDGLRIQKFDGSGNHLLSWGREALTIAQPKEPNGLDVAGNGNIYVTDNINHRIHIFLATGFTLDDAQPDDGDNISNTVTFAGVPSGMYTVTELLPAGWNLAGIDCQSDDPADTTVTGPDFVAVDLDPGEHMTCTFSNINLALGEVSAESVLENELSTVSGEILFADPQSSFTMTVDWGDGSGPETFLYPPGTTAFSETHPYLDDDPSGTSADIYNISIDLLTEDGASTSGGASITVANVAPDLAGLAATSPVSETGVVSLTGSIVDPGSLDTLTVTVDWGDGSVESFAYPAGSTTFLENHIYDDDALAGLTDFPIQVQAADDDLGLSATYLVTVTVGNAAPSLNNLLAGDVNEYGTATLSGAIVDLSPLDTFTLTVDWGDGSSDVFSYPAGSTAFTETHHYLDDDPTGTPADLYTITLTLMDDNGGVDVASTSLTVHNVAPELGGLAWPAAIQENETLTMTGVISDVGLLDTFDLLVDWGDGAVMTYSLGAGIDQPSQPFTISHPYLDDNPTGTPADLYTVTLTLVDDDGGTAGAQAAVEVQNVAPEVDAGPDQNVYAGDPVAFSGAFSDPGSLDSHTIHWDFGNGLTTTGSLTPSTVYNVPGTYTVTLTVRDDDGGESVDTLQVTVTADAYNIYLPLLSNGFSAPLQTPTAGPPDWVRGQFAHLPASIGARRLGAVFNNEDDSNV